MAISDNEIPVVIPSKVVLKLNRDSIASGSARIYMVLYLNNVLLPANLILTSGLIDAETLRHVKGRAIALVRDDPLSLRCGRTWTTAKIGEYGLIVVSSVPSKTKIRAI